MGKPFPSSGDLPDPGIKPRSPALQADSLASEPPRKPRNRYLKILYRDFPGGPVVKTSRPKGGGAGSLLSGGLRPHMPPSQKTKTQHRNHTLTHSTQMLKTVYMQKVFFKKDTMEKSIYIFRSVLSLHGSFYGNRHWGFQNFRGLCVWEADSDLPQKTEC